MWQFLSLWVARLAGGLGGKIRVMVGQILTELFRQLWMAGIPSLISVSTIGTQSFSELLMGFFKGCCRVNGPATIAINCTDMDYL